MIGATGAGPVALACAERPDAAVCAAVAGAALAPRSPPPVRFASLASSRPPRWLRAAAYAIDDPRLHRDARAQVRALLRLGALGVPVVARPLPAPVARAVGPEVANALLAGTPRDMEDPIMRARRGVDLRRAVLARGMAAAAAPAVSVTVATRRPALLDHLLAQLACQTYRPLEVVLALHGGGFPPDVHERAAARLPLPVTVRPVAAAHSLGRALRAAAHAASGTILAKVDDDDLYGPHHVTDLVLALRLTSADLVGKAAEFVYLAGSDLTVWRPFGNHDGPSVWEQRYRHVAGGTLALRADTLAATGGWPDARRSVDRALRHALQRRGGTVARSHPFGYVLRRHGCGHVWAAPDADFLAQSRAQWRGLAGAVADVPCTGLPPAPSGLLG